MTLLACELLPSYNILFEQFIVLRTLEILFIPQSGTAKHCIAPGVGPILTSSRVVGFRGAALRHVVMVSGCWVYVPPPLTVSGIIEIGRSRLEFARPLDNSSHRNIFQGTQKQEAILPSTIRQYTQAQS